MLLNKKKRLSVTARTRLLCLLLGTSMAPPLGALRVGLNTFNDAVTVSYGDKVTIIDGGIVRADDGYSSINGFRLNDVGDTAGYQFRDNSLFTVTLTGYQYGQTIALPIKLGRTTFSLQAVSYGIYNDTHMVNKGCVRVEPSNSNGPAVVQTIDINPGNNIHQNCTGNTIQFRYNDIRPSRGVRREVLFDLPTMMHSEAYQRLPPDLYYITTTITGLEHWAARVGGSHDFPLPLEIKIRKQAYFSGLSLPSTTMPLKVIYAGQRVQGHASMPITLRGAFDPQFGRVSLSAQSSGNFSLRSGNNEIPYRAEAVVNQQRYALNNSSGARPPIVLSNLNDVRQIPLWLEVTFDQPREQISASGNYRDNLTLIAEVPLV